MESELPDPNLLGAVRDRMSKQAMQLGSLLGPTWAASTFLGACTGLLIGSMGRTKASEWLRAQADELETIEGEKPN